MFRYSEFMNKKSVIIGLPVVPYNQSKPADVCQYLEYVQKLLVDIYKPQVINHYLLIFQSQIINYRIQDRKSSNVTTRTSMLGHISLKFNKYKWQTYAFHSLIKLLKYNRWVLKEHNNFTCLWTFNLMYQIVLQKNLKFCKECMSS